MNRLFCLRALYGNAKPVEFTFIAKDETDAKVQAERWRRRAASNGFAVLESVSVREFHPGRIDADGYCVSEWGLSSISVWDRQQDAAEMARAMIPDSMPIGGAV